MRRLRTSIERLVEAGCAAGGLLLLAPVLAALALKVWPVKISGQGRGLYPARWTSNNRGTSARATGSAEP